MNTNPKIHAMIVAAGRGSRFGASIAKQYLLIHGQTLLQHSVAKLADSAYVDSCFLVIAANDDTARKLSFALPINFVTGGAERWQSVLKGLEAIIAAGAEDCDLVLIHDAARPAVPVNDVDSVIKAAMVEPYGAILATPVADTLKQSQSNSTNQEPEHYYATRTVDRSDMWQAQTPQVFRVRELHQVLTYVVLKQLPITDEASAFEYLSLPVRLVHGSRQNIKLTYSEDEFLIKLLLK